MSGTVDEARVDFWACFLWHGGVFSPTEWRALQKEDLAALTEASAKIEARRATMVAQAILDLSRPPDKDPVEAAMDRNDAKALGGP